jgi:hypothetical protein
MGPHAYRGTGWAHSLSTYIRSTYCLWTQIFSMKRRKNPGILGSNSNGELVRNTDGHKQVKKMWPCHGLLWICLWLPLCQWEWWARGATQRVSGHWEKREGTITECGNIHASWCGKVLTAPVMQYIRMRFMASPAPRNQRDLWTKNYGWYMLPLGSQGRLEIQSWHLWESIFSTTAISVRLAHAVHIIVKQKKRDSQTLTIW